MTMTREENARELEAGARLVSVDNPSIGGVMMAAAAMLREDNEIQMIMGKGHLVNHTLLTEALAGLEPFTKLLVYISEHVPNSNKIVLAEVWNSRTICTVGDIRIARNLCARLEAALRGSIEPAGEQT